ncbi:hypothetical protein HYH03_012261 [Edaphochlamys debaryana]|uniref:Bulb-type lectin domain-containing protein n=1 Tax=Edaphochlamys debaryana TaxID=47281 RepID=A0A835XT83_9CHLO|nr:hypothetical protein HYH03_012261 [Edaphochlamys debaryana]|eukprot:KAG2489240.1 hypothetical protein HYH03_012261 [Edaphochlamys debaryana]
MPARHRVSALLVGAALLVLCAKPAALVIYPGRPCAPNRAFGCQVRCGLYQAPLGDVDEPCSRLWSPGRTHYLIMQHDGNLVLYRAIDRFPLWATGTALPGATNFSLLLTPGGGWDVWGGVPGLLGWGRRATSGQGVPPPGGSYTHPQNTGGFNGPFFMRVEDNGNMHLLNKYGAPAWSSYPAQSPPPKPPSPSPPSPKPPSPPPPVPSPRALPGPLYINGSLVCSTARNHATRGCSRVPRCGLYQGTTNLDDRCNQLWSPLRRFYLGLEADGNLVLYRVDNAATGAKTVFWSTLTAVQGAAGFAFLLQANGTWALWGSSVWAGLGVFKRSSDPVPGIGLSITYPDHVGQSKGPFSFLVLDNGRMELRNGAGGVAWANYRVPSPPRPPVPPKPPSPRPRPSPRPPSPRPPFPRPPPTLDLYRVYAGASHTCAEIGPSMGTPASLKCWGANDMGQLGVGSAAPFIGGSGITEMGGNLRSVDFGSCTFGGARVGTDLTCGLCYPPGVPAGTVKCFGANVDGQLGQGSTAPYLGGSPYEIGDSMPAVQLGPFSMIRGIAAGGSHVCVLLELLGVTLKEVKCWGRNNVGQLGIGDTTPRGLAAFDMGPSLRPAPVGSGLNPNDIFAGADHNCVMFIDGRFKCWGGNAFGQLGYGNTDNRGDVPNEMGDSLAFVDVGSAGPPWALGLGDGFSCAILAAGVKCWGRNDYGQLGTGDRVTRGRLPGEMGDALPLVALGAGYSANAVAAGGWHTRNHRGQLGYGDNVDRLQPGNDIDFGPGLYPVAISAGREHTCAVLEPGRVVKCWGANDRGQLGTGDTVDRASPRPLAPVPLRPWSVAFPPFAPQSPPPSPPLPPFSPPPPPLPAPPPQRIEIWQVQPSAYHTCVLADRSFVAKLRCWGWNVNGELGIGSRVQVGDSPAEMGQALAAFDPGPGWALAAVAVATGGFFSCAVLEGASGQSAVKCFGSNINGELGQGTTALALGDTPASTGAGLPPVDLGPGAAVDSLAAGQYHVCALVRTTLETAVRCWGYNMFGQLGAGNIVPRGRSPGDMGAFLPNVPLGTGLTPSRVFAGADHNCVIFSDNRLKCWGGNAFGQLGLGDTHNRGDHPGEMGDSLAFVNLGDQVYPRQLALGSGFACAILARTGTGATLGVKCWGRNDYGQLGTGDRVTRGTAAADMGPALPLMTFEGGLYPVAITAGGTHACVMLFPGPRVRCWGRNNAGQLGYGDTVDRLSPGIVDIDFGPGAYAGRISAGLETTCAMVNQVSQFDQVMCWGSNSRAQLGTGDTLNRLTPTPALIQPWF